MGDICRPYQGIMTLADIRARALAQLTPPPRLPLSQWIEQNIILPDDV
jgi:hypothetical protein